MTPHPTPHARCWMGPGSAACGIAGWGWVFVTRPHSVPSCTLYLTALGTLPMLLGWQCHHGPGGLAGLAAAYPAVRGLRSRQGTAPSQLLLQGNRGRSVRLGGTRQRKSVPGKCRGLGEDCRGQRGGALCHSPGAGCVSLLTPPVTQPGQGAGMAAGQHPGPRLPAGPAARPQGQGQQDWRDPASTIPGPHCQAMCQGQVTLGPQCPGEG